ncbi:MAG: hypothetical protein JXO72_01255 [Vicinamibacteria bacterium]|nr:hypothetical protein [Vicinamibacteria bacterium]
MSSNVGLWLAVFAGVVLRTDQLLRQIPQGDEWHSLHDIVRFDYGRLLTNFSWTSYSIPWAVYQRVIADTVGLSEVWYRAPALLCGAAALIAIPCLVRPWIGRTPSHVLAWLLAISPFHVYFSRFARPYSAALLVAFMGSVAFYRWWIHGGRRWALFYVTSAVIGPFLHLSVIAAACVPLAYGMVAHLATGGRSAKNRSLGDLLRLALALLTGFVCVFGPPMAISGSWLIRKAGLDAPTLTTILGAARILLGANSLFALVLICLAGVGALMMWREQRQFVLYFGVLVVATFVVPFIARPVSVNMPIVFARYCLFILPVLLIPVALALALLGERLHRLWPVVPKSTLAAAFCMILFVRGPLPKIHYRPNNWTNHDAFHQVDFDEPAATTCAHELSPFYKKLRSSPPGSLTIAEAPWLFMRPSAFPCYQRIHRQWMLLGFVGKRDRTRRYFLPRPGELPDEGPRGRFRFRNFVHVGDHGALRERGVRYVVFHRAVEKELGAEPPQSRGVAARWIQEYRLVYGAPIYKDRWLVVFDVAVNRERRHVSGIQ